MILGGFLSAFQLCGGLGVAGAGCLAGFQQKKRNENGFKTFFLACGGGFVLVRIKNGFFSVLV